MNPYNPGPPPLDALTPGPAAASRRRQAVECRGVVKDFGEGDTRVQALRGIDVTIPAGELTLLVGPSGCGKTTLISLIAGLLEPTAGQILVLGQDLTALSGRAKVE